MSTEPTLFHFDDGRESFEDLGHKNGATHWREDDLMRAMGYQTKTSFQKAISRAKQACLSLGWQCEDHFARQPDGSHFITRFGCYLVAMNGDNKKVEVAAAQAYFATIAQTFQTYLEHADGIDRMLIRDEVTDGQKSLAATAKAHGVVEYGFFQNQGYMGMYNMSLDKLVQYKGLARGECLIDYMGKAELAAHLFRITQTDERIKRDSIRGQHRLEQTAREIGRKVRAAVQDMSGQSPEDIPAAENINSVRKKVKGANKAFRSLEKTRKSLPNPPSP